MIGFLSALSTLVGAIKPILADRGTQILIKEGLPHAEAIIKKLADANLTSGQKRQAARNELRAALKDSLGIAAPPDSILNFLIELVYSKVKAAQPTVGATSPVAPPAAPPPPAKK